MLWLWRILKLAFYVYQLIFSKYAKESCFLGSWKVSFVAPVLKSVRERFVAKKTVFCKIFEKFVNSRFVDHLEKLGSYFQYCFGSSALTTDLLTVFTKDCNRSGVTGAAALYLFKTFDRFGVLVFFTNANLMEFQVHFLVFFPAFLSNRRHWVVLDGKFLQEFL